MSRLRKVEEEIELEEPRDKVIVVRKDEIQKLERLLRDESKEDPMRVCAVTRGDERDSLRVPMKMYRLMKSMIEEGKTEAEVLERLRKIVWLKPK